MDPNANITEQINCLHAIAIARADGRQSGAYARRYDELRRAYSGWRFAGGFPAADSLLRELDSLQSACRNL